MAVDMQINICKIKHWHSLYTRKQGGCKVH